MAPAPLVFLVMKWKVISRGPSAFLEALPMALGWDGDARVWGKAEKVGRERKPTINSLHLRAAPDSLKQPSAEAQRKREGGKAPEMGTSHISDPFLGLPSRAWHLCGTGWDQSPQPWDPQAKEREKSFG